MSATTRVATATLVLAGAGLVAPPAAAQGGYPAPTGRPDAPFFRYTRPVDVADAGWVRLPLDPATRARMAPDGADLRVFGPGGEVQSEIRSTLGEAPRRLGATIDQVEETPEGWTLTIDAGRDVPRHWRLTFAFANRATVPGVRLEASADGLEWLPLAEADLFRLGEATGLARTTIDYPATDARLLRLSWPGAAGLPDVRAVEIETAPGPEGEPLAVPIAVTEASAGLRGVAYDLALPGPGLPVSWTELEWAGSGSAGYRLLAPSRGRWLERRTGVAQRGTERLDGSLVAPDAAPLRLELFTVGVDTLRLERATALVPPEQLLFFAPAAGRFTLAYGGTGVGRPRPTHDRAERPAALATVPEAAAGAEEMHPLPDLPASAVAPGAQLRSTAFAAEWRVNAEGVAPGTLVRLVLPADLYAEASRTDLSDLRLTTGDRQVPYVPWVPPAPVLVTEAIGLSPESIGRPGTSRIAIELPAADLPLGEMELAAPAAPFSRPLRLHWAVVETSPRGEPTRRLLSAGGATWSCPGASALPCLVRLALRPNPSTELAITFDDGDNRPLAAVDARLWRRSDALIFPWPDTGDVRLVVLSSSTGAPRYDLALIADQVRARPAVDATAERLEPPAAPSPVDEGPAQLALIGALALAAVALLALLVRMLPTAGAADTE